MPEQVVMNTEVDKGNTVREGEESETSEQTQAQETDQTGKTGEVEKTQEKTEESEGTDTEESQNQDEGEEESNLLKTKQPIPFERFKSFVDKRNTERGELANLKGLLEDPTIFRAVLQSKGITDPKILDEKMREAGFEATAKEEESEENLFKEFSKGLDLTKTESWFKMMQKISQHYARDAVKPIEGKLSEKEVGAWISSQESEATKLAEKFDIPYGKSGKDEKNANTAVGIMAKYLSEHPEDAGLGHVKVLRLALSEKGFQVGKEKGVQSEKKRNDALRRSQMEDEGQVTRDGTPNKDWSVTEILAWRRKQKG